MFILELGICTFRHFATVFLSFKCIRLVSLSNYEYLRAKMELEVSDFLRIPACSSSMEPCA